MANNRLYLVDTETGESIMLAKGFGFGWSWRVDNEKIENWIVDKDILASCGPEHPTNLRLMNESEEMEFRKNWKP